MTFSPKRLSKRYRGLTTAFALAFLALAPRTLGAEARLVFYDPDANHRSIVNLTTWFNQWLASIDPELRFQPVQSREDFERLMSSPESQFAMVSSEYLKSSQNRSLKPLQVPASGDDPFYHKLLIRKLVAEGAASAEPRTVAATLPGSGKKGRSRLRSTLRRAGINIDVTTIIPVTKDIDALLALSFGQVDAALVTPSSLDVLRRINPNAAALFEQGAKSKPILRAPLSATPHTTQALLEAVTRALETMADEPNGRRVLRTLDVDGWVLFKPEMMQR